MPIHQSNFKFNLAQEVTISVSGEQGAIRARSDGVERANQYLITYKNALGTAVEAWWSEDLLESAG